jgi:hypothetical protein
MALLCLALVGLGHVPAMAAEPAAPASAAPASPADSGGATATLTFAPDPTVRTNQVFFRMDAKCHQDFMYIGETNNPFHKNKGGPYILNAGDRYYFSIMTQVTMSYQYCRGVASFVPERGHIYQATQGYIVGGACKIKLIDLASGETPPSFQDIRFEQGLFGLKCQAARPAEAEGRP